MKSIDKKRDEASEALIALRKRMGKTQQTFAVEVLQCAINTIARFESSNPPPRGKVLLRLRDIASDEGFDDLAQTFQDLFKRDDSKIRRATLSIDPVTPESDLRAELNIELIGEDALAAGQALMVLVPQLNSPDPRIKEHAIRTVESLWKASHKYESRAVSDSQNAIRVAQAQLKLLRRKER